MTTTATDGTEEAALATGGGPGVLVPGYAWQAYDVADTLSTYAATLADTASSLSRIEITGWAGPTATQAHTRLGQAPTHWVSAGSALQTAAQAMRSYAAAFIPAQQLASQAEQVYGQYVITCGGIAHTLGAPVPASQAERLQLLLTADSDARTHDAARAADTLRRTAIDDLARARAIISSAGDDTAAALTRATADAPAARTFWQGTIREPGAETAAHTSLDALSLIPGWGTLAALTNAGWYAHEGRTHDAAWAAAGAIPFGRIATELHTVANATVTARTFTSKAELLAREADDLDGLATDFGLTKIADQTYRSPAGLVYRGLPPTSYEESHRLTHVLSHGFADEAKTTHSVFKGGTRDVIDLVDEAWSTHPKPVPGDPMRFEVNMDRVVGAEGERRLVIVVKASDPPRLISAYPIH